MSGSIHKHVAKDGTVNDPQAAALLEEADAALTRLWEHVSTEQGRERGEGR